MHDWGTLRTITALVAWLTVAGGLTMMAIWLIAGGGRAAGPEDETFAPDARAGVPMRRGVTAIGAGPLALPALHRDPWTFRRGGRAAAAGRRA